VHAKAGRDTVDTGVRPRSEPILDAAQQKRAESESSSDEWCFVAPTVAVPESEVVPESGQRLLGAAVLAALASGDKNEKGGCVRNSQPVRWSNVEAGALVSGKYRLQRRLGAGSMGSVWAARNELTNRDFAVKFLLPELSRSEDALNRFFLEARACGQIRHPAIVDVYDMGQAEDGSPYLVMELLEGEGLDARIGRQTYLRPADVCRYVASVARGLDEAHTRGLIHRDLKPGNIFFAIDKGGDVFPKVLDFGISKETSAEHFDYVKTSTGTVLGSPAYMSPEQARGELDVDARTDIWSLGVIMYEALTGELPFDANNYNALMLCIITQPHRPVIEVAPDVPLELSQLVDCCLHKERNRRLRSAGELAGHLEHIYSRLTQTPLHRPERHLSMPPIGDGTTQHGWFKVRTASGQSKISPGVLVGAALAMVGLVGGGLAIADASASAGGTVQAGKLGGTISVIAARAESQFTQAAAEHETRAATEAARDAERRAQEAINKPNSDDDDKAPKGPAAPRPPRPKGSADVHGGVKGPGF
jgi:serine/threonine protein kinase